MAKPTSSELPRERAEYVPPRTIPRLFDAQTMEMQTVKLHKEFDPRQATTQTSIRALRRSGWPLTWLAAGAAAAGAAIAYVSFAQVSGSLPATPSASAAPLAALSSALMMQAPASAVPVASALPSEAAVPGGQARPRPLLISELPPLGKPAKARSTASTAARVGVAVESNRSGSQRHPKKLRRSEPAPSAATALPTKLAPSGRRTASDLPTPSTRTRSDGQTGEGPGAIVQPQDAKPREAKKGSRTWVNLKKPKVWLD